ncbi:MAG: DUF2852 domain-containing protein [Hyphomicrobiales bacterium]
MLRSIIYKLDDWGRPGWLAAMIGGFVVFWPVGLVILSYMIWSGRMRCNSWAYAHGDEGRTMWGRDKWNRKMDRLQSKMDRMRSFFGQDEQARDDRAPFFRPTGNRAFDDYREETLDKLEREADEFRSFLDRLRHAKDKAEFDQFMAERRASDDTSSPSRDLSA